MLRLSEWAAEVAEGARRFDWGRLAYLLAMAGAAGAAIALLLLSVATAHATTWAAQAVPPAVAVVEPGNLLEHLRDNFLIWAMLLGSTVLVGLALPFVCSGALALVTRVLLSLLSGSTVVAGVLLIAAAWLAAVASRGAIGVTMHRSCPRLARIEAAMRDTMQVLMSRFVR